MGSSTKTAGTERESFSNESVEYILLDDTTGNDVGIGTSSSHHNGTLNSPRSTSSMNRVIYVPQHDTNVRSNSIRSLDRISPNNHNNLSNSATSTVASGTVTAMTPQRDTNNKQKKKSSYYSSLKHLMSPLLPIAHSPQRRNDLNETINSNDNDDTEEIMTEDTTTSSSRRATIYHDSLTTNDGDNHHEGNDNSNDDDHHHHRHNNHDENKLDLVPSPEFHNSSLTPRARTETELTIDDEEVAMLINQQRSHSQRSHTLSSSRRNSENNMNNNSPSDSIRNQNQYVVIRNRFHQTQPIELNGLNYLNAVTYAAHLFVSWGVGVWGLDHLMYTRWEITTMYETLITPSEWSSFYVLAIIMILESIFTIAQLVRYYRARSIIQAGTKFYFFYTFIWQTAFTLFYCYELFILSFISVIGTLISLLLLIYSQEQHNSYSNYNSSNHQNHGSSIGNNILSRGNSHQRRHHQKHMTEYFLFRLPFYVHTGYMFCLTVNHLSLLIRYYLNDQHIAFQLCIDMIALSILLPIATFSLTRYEPDFIIPIVIMLNYLGIGCRLGHPSAMLLQLYGSVVIHAVRYASFSLAGIVLCCLIPNAVIWFARAFCTINVIELD